MQQTATESRTELAPAVPSEGWAVLHLAFAIRGDRAQPVDVAPAARLVAELEAEPGYQVRAYSILGQRGDLGLMVIGPDFARLNRLHVELMRTALGARLEERPELGFVSLTEASEYLEDDGTAAAAARRDARLHPHDLPQRRVLCFYPMTKRRAAHANWFALPFEERKRLMYGHGKSGRAFAGRITQLITAATGLCDWEWGVTLFADDVKAIKDVVYEMRFDEVSAQYAEFGPFTVGLVAPFAGAVAEAGLLSA